MVKCCVCNLYPESRVGLNLTFHSIPKKQELKQQWKSDLGTRFKEEGFVCSAHFSPEQFTTRINNKRQRILPEAVPSINLASCFTSDSQENAIPDGFEKYADHTDKEKNINPVPEIKSTNIASLVDGENSASVHLEEAEPSTSIVRDMIPDSCQETMPDEPLNSESNINQRLNKKQKCPFSDEIQSTKIRTVKVLGDFKPEDFKNPMDHRVITKYLKKHNSKTKELQQKVRRLEKQVDTFKSIMKDLKSRGLLSTDTALELNHTISLELQELSTRAMASKSSSYSPKLQEFAASLMFYSNAAYEYVRSKLAVLPHPETVRRWFRNIKFTPGISNPVLESIKETHSNLYFGMMCDEMHIKKHVETDDKVTYGFVDVGAGATNDTSEASAALVYMIVALNGHLKAPIAFYLINGMGAQARANITTNILCILHEYNMQEEAEFIDGIASATDESANKRRRALYLEEMKSTIRDIITIEKHLSIPVLKNGSNRDSGLPIIDGRKVLVQDTFAFDSIFQLILAATFDFQKVFDIVQSLENTEKYFELIKHVKEKGIGAKAYQMRANILKDYYAIEEHITVPGLFVMKCQQNVGFLAERLFSAIPSYIQNINCSEGCYSREESFTSYEVPITVWHENLEKLLVRICELATKDSPCTTNKCDGVRQTKHVIGDIVLIQFDNVFSEIKVSLKDLPRYITIPGNNESKLQIMGLVDYRCYRKTRKEEESKGHYTTFALRRDRVWCEYDDLYGTSTYKFNKKQQTLVPILLLLMKTKNDPNF